MAPLHKQLNYLYQLNRSSRPLELMTSDDLTNWWSMLIKPDQASNEEFRTRLSNPEFLVRFGYLNLNRDFSWISEATFELGACFSMVGVGAIEILLAGTCELCHLRRTAPAATRCDQCSRSKRLIDPEELRSQAARSLRNKRVRDSSVVTLNATSADLHDSFSRSIASLLFRMRKRSPPHLLWMKRVQAALDVAPHVRAKLNPSFLEMEHGAQLSALRHVIDAHEWDYGQWPEKILRAQALFESAEVLTGRRRIKGPLQQTKDLANRARALLRQGLSKTEVACQLSISKSHLSHVLGRTSHLDER